MAAGVGREVANESLTTGGGCQISLARRDRATCKSRLQVAPMAICFLFSKLAQGSEMSLAGER